MVVMYPCVSLIKQRERERERGRLEEGVREEGTDGTSAPACATSGASGPGSMGPEERWCVCVCVSLMYRDGGY